MILLAGIPSEEPMAMVRTALDALGSAYRMFDQRDHAGARFCLTIAGDGAGGAVGGYLETADERIELANVGGFYTRMMDDGSLLAAAPGGHDAQTVRRCRRLHEQMMIWSDIAPGRVLNRPSAMASNQSKPYQAHVIRACGFATPETLISNDPQIVREYIEAQWAAGHEVIYKSISGVRSIVERVTPADVQRLHRIRVCPVQFQQRVEGVDIRVHTVGHAVFAVEITSNATDYRYASRQTGSAPSLRAVTLEADVALRCVKLAEVLGLPLAGIDLRRTPEGEYFCFEVNPSPAFSYYENAAGVAISPAIARHLAGEDALA